jgi:hypothetical protein
MAAPCVGHERANALVATAPGRGSRESGRGSTRPTMTASHGVAGTALFKQQQRRPRHAVRRGQSNQNSGGPATLFGAARAAVLRSMLG